MRYAVSIILICWAVLMTAGMLTPAGAQDTPATNDDMSSAIKTFAGMSPGDKDMILASAGLPSAKSFDLGKLIAITIFSSIGFIAFMYGKKNSFMRPLILGIGLMVYPYCVSSTLWIYGIGIALTAALYFWRD